MEIQGFNDVFSALEDTPQAAANMRARADMMQPLIRHINLWNLTQEEAATRLGVTRPRLSDLLRGKLGKFSLDALVNLTTAAGLTLHIQVDVAA